MLLTGCQENQTASRLIISAPPRLSQAQTSINGALCSALAVDLTLDAEHLDTPAVDRVPLVPKTNSLCRWALAKPVPVPEGTYDLVVRFAFTTPADDCGDTPVFVGAFFKPDVTFPWRSEFAGLTSDDFLSRATDGVVYPELGLDFDNDGDGLDNLLELASGTNTCRFTAPPSVTLEVEDGQEGVTLPIALTVQAESLPESARFILSLTHQNDLATRPEYHTNTITVVSPGGPGDISPSLIDRPQRERWDMVTSAPAATTWLIDFLPEEPFVGPLNVGAVVDDGFGELITSTGQTIEVANVNDPPRLLFQLGDREQVLDIVPFAEVLPGAGDLGHRATLHIFRFVDDDVNSPAVAGPSSWRPELGTNFYGVTLTQDEAFWILGWEPTNAQAISPPAGSFAVTMDFYDPGEALVDTVEIPLAITPRWNDIPRFMPPALGKRVLPAQPFLSHTMTFTVWDPDRVAAAPSCEVALLPNAAGGTTCTDAFAAVTCEALGPWADDAWTFEITLEPQADYFAACGATPSFLASIVITDVPPAGATNGPQMVATWCASPDLWGYCQDNPQTQFLLNTWNIVIPTVVAGGPAAPVEFSSPSPLMIHGAAEAGAVELTAAGSKAVYLLDLTYLDPSFAYRFGDTELCSLDDRPRFGIADEVNDRLLLVGRRAGVDPCAQGERVAVLVDLPPDPKDLQTPSFVTFAYDQLCGSDDRHPDYATDTSGNIYLPCTADAGLARLDPAGTVLREPLPAYHNNGSHTYLAAIISDAGGDEWLVLPDNAGILLVELNTFDGDPVTPPVTKRVGQGEGIDHLRIADAVVDDSRGAYNFIFVNPSDQVELYRLRLELVAAAYEPLLAGPLLPGLSDSERRSRLILRVPGSEPTAEVDLVIEPNGADPWPHIDLDTFTIVDTRPAFNPGLGPGLLPTPDKRIYVAPTSCSSAACDRGLYIFPWEWTSDPTFIDLGTVPDGGEEMAITVSQTGYMLANATAQALEVYYFVAAKQGQDE